MQITDYLAGKGIENRMISVIVPAYNVELYLKRCVDSLINQTYQDLEIILVNDGSTDGTGKLCEEIAGSDNRIKVIHKENGGLSDARNAGIDISEGEFLSFIDGDDYIELDMYALLIAEMKNPKVSIAVGGFIVTDTQGNVKNNVSARKQYFTKEEAFLNLFGEENDISQSSCNKLFRRNLFENIRYKKGILNEDMEILPRLLDISEGVAVIDRPVYHYIKKPGSITSSNYSMERYRAVKIERDIYLMCKRKYPDLKPFASYYELKSLYEMLYNLSQCNNCNQFKWQEICIRWKIFVVLIRCMKWKMVRKTHGDDMKIYFLTSIFGIEGLKKAAKLKTKLLGS